MAITPRKPISDAPAGGAKRQNGLPSRLSTLGIHLVLSVVSLGLFAVIIVFVRSSHLARSRSERKLHLSGILRTDVSTMLAVVRTAQGLLTALTSLILRDLFVFIQWQMMDLQDGIPFLSLLALSPSTSNFGMVSLLRTPKSGASTKAWAMLRLSLTIIVWLAGLVLFFKTSIITVYDTAYTYNATAGVGGFNASLVQPFLNLLASLDPQYPFEILPYTYFAAAYVLVMNPLIATVSTPVKCKNDGCVSYLLSGGLEMVAPWVPKGYDSYPMVKINSAPAVQLDFTAPTNEPFIDKDCDVFGQLGFTIGIKFCVTGVPGSPESLRAGLFVCSNGTNDNICHTTDPAPNITTVVSFYTRKATVISARSNYSIVSIEDTTSPVPVQDLDIITYRMALAWLLNYTDAAIPAPSSIAQSFWSSSNQLRDPSTYGILSQNFQSVLAFPFWLFNSNNWGNVQLKSNDIIPWLPTEFYTEASFVKPYIKIQFANAMFILFITLQGLALLFIWAVLIWGCFDFRSHMPVISSYPLFDVMFKSAVTSVAHDWTQRNTFIAGTSNIVDTMKDARAVTKLE